MSPYSLVLFLHVIGSIALFVGLGTIILSSFALRRVRTVEQLRALILPLTAGRKIGFEHISVVDLLVVAGVLLIGLSAFYMVTSAWSFDVAWVRVAIAATLLVAPLGPVLVNPRLQAIARASEAAQDGPLDASLLARAGDPVLALALYVTAAVLVGVVFLMTNKPSALESLAVIGIAALIGAVAGLPAMRRARVKRVVRI